MVDAAWRMSSCIRLHQHEEAIELDFWMSEMKAVRLESIGSLTMRSVEKPVAGHCNPDKQLAWPGNR
ncbi:hypothetical protein ACCS64_37620, partial [Rhizobium ruizarguesonis]